MNSGPRLTIGSTGPDVRRLQIIFVMTKLLDVSSIDGIFGPSETVIIADTNANPTLVAADMLAGAEHDELATAILLTDSEKIANEVSAIVEREVTGLARAEAARTAGCTSLLLQSPWVGNVHHDFVLLDLDAIAEKILSLKQQVEFV